MPRLHDTLAAARFARTDARDDEHTSGDIEQPAHWSPPEGPPSELPNESDPSVDATDNDPSSEDEHQQVPDETDSDGDTPQPKVSPLLQAEDVWVPKLVELVRPLEFTDPEPSFIGIGKWTTRRRLAHAAMKHYEEAVQQINKLNANLRDELRIFSTRTSLVIVVTHFKGGNGKTPLSTALATVMADATGLDVLVFDANPDMGGAADLLGVSGRTRYISDLANDLDFMSYADLTRGMMATNHRVRVAAGDPPGLASRIDVDNFRVAIEKLQKHFSIIIMDTGTNVSGQIGLKAIELADAVVIPLLTIKGPRELNGSVSGCEFTHNYLTGEALSGLDNPETFQRKIHNSITTLLGLRPDEDMMPFLEGLTRSDWVRAIVPFDKLMHSKTHPMQLVPPLDPRVPEPWRDERSGETIALNPVTQYYLQRLAKLCYLQALTEEATSTAE